jgi:hypothetical protein
MPSQVTGHNLTDDLLGKPAEFQSYWSNIAEIMIWTRNVRLLRLLKTNKCCRPCSGLCALPDNICFDRDRSLTTSGLHSFPGKKEVGLWKHNAGRLCVCVCACPQNSEPIPRFSQNVEKKKKLNLPERRKNSGLNRIERLRIVLNNIKQCTFVCIRYIDFEFFCYVTAWCVSLIKFLFVSVKYKLIFLKERELF